MEIKFGFHKAEPKKEEEKYDFPHLTLLARGVNKTVTKKFSVFKLSKQALELLNYTNISGQVIGVAEISENEFLLINTTGYRTAKDSYNFQLSSKGTFSSGTFYNKLIKVGGFEKDDIDNHFRIVKEELVQFQSTDGSKTHNADAVKIVLLEDVTDETSIKKTVEEIKEEIPEFDK